MAAKLFIVTRADLSAGQQAVQGMHAFREFVKDHPEIEQAWHTVSNTLAFLSTKDEPSLLSLYEEARLRGIKVSLFREPDRNDEVTAITLEPRGKRLCQGLDLALDAA